MARILSIVLLVSGLATAQQAAQSKHELSAWGARSFATGHAFGFAVNRSLTFVALRYGRSVGNWRDINFRYMIEARPIAVLGDLETSGGPERRAYKYAAGFSPIGLQITPWSSKKTHPFLASNGGFLYFNRRVLHPEGTQFQFTIYIAAGIEVPVRGRTALKFGYMYHHFSNANIYRHNPALDKHMFFAGISIYR